MILRATAAAARARSTSNHHQFFPSLLLRPLQPDVRLVGTTTPSIGLMPVEPNPFSASTHCSRTTFDTISTSQNKHPLFNLSPLHSGGVTLPSSSAFQIRTISTAGRAEVEDAEEEATAAATNIEQKEPRKLTPQLTKIVATIGPTSEQLDVLQEVVRGGMRVMRLNFSHATREEVELRCTNLRLCQGLHSEISRPHKIDCEFNVRGVLLDTRGPEIRTGTLRDDHSGHDTVHIETGSTVTLHTTQHWADIGSTAEDLYVDYPSLHKSVSPGMKVLLDDGAVALTVVDVEKKEFHGSVECTVDNGGDLRSRAGVNLPGAETDLPALSEKDKVDIKYGMTMDIDYVAASFVQNAAGVHEIRRYLEQCASELKWDPQAPLPVLISKIESVSALRNFDEILEASDGIMVARGDLGVEIPIQQVTNAQKEMVAACNAVGKPVIVATQMLESMAKNPRPTRAEVADVTNAVYDGADAVMLSGETAKGKYPVEAVTMMNEIIQSAEELASTRPDALVRTGTHGSRIFAQIAADRRRSRGASIAKAAVTAAEERHAKAIMCWTSSGNLPRLVSAYRPHVPIVAFCPSAKVARQLILHRGVHPVVGYGRSELSLSRRQATAIMDAKSMGLVQEGDDVVILAMEEGDGMSGNLATMKIAHVP